MGSDLSGVDLTDLDNFAHGRLSEVLATFSHFELDSVPEWTRSNRHTGLRHLPLRMTRPVTSAGSR